MSNTTTERTPNVRFAAIDKVVVSNIVLPTEKEVRGRGGNDMVTWGPNNDYPEYLLSLYNNVASLRSCINGCVDYVLGDAVNLAPGIARPRGGDTLNLKGEDAADVARAAALDYYLFGGFALQVIRRADGGVAEVYHVPMRCLRTDKECNVFYYSEEFAKKYARQDKVVVYPKYIPAPEGAAPGELAPTGIVYVKTTGTLQTYPAPLYAASIKACETERCIDDFHLDSIQNGFAASYFINFNNGIPDDEQKAEIERDIFEKFLGPNGMKLGISFNKDFASRVTFEKLDVTDYGEKYESLARHCRQQVFTSFRANPNLFGIPTDSLGFSSEEYESSFRLFNRTQIRPVQQLITSAFDFIYGVEDSVTFTPFTLG